VKFRKKPIVIEAEQFFSDKHPWPEGVYINHGFKIDTLEGQYTVSEKDWIITGIKGEKYPCKPYIFEATYEKVDE